jgi:hypothetical protein
MPSGSIKDRRSKAMKGKKCEEEGAEDEIRREGIGIMKWRTAEERRMTEETRRKENKIKIKVKLSSCLIS